ncbi:uncharacterized protein CLUP02_10737 [Colletotrichum lupini]|uniref:Uncharacterized protein n=1 Tax=Colletotrichum lupini TaxID=145971 RepID=A0A9Q8SY21_9PEZI|nr:uncharacterized protein CLUP02_10737 [Colletotrichum lupini]UQC85240.1 hypothetical protein CLUP02_10737 [Colletotrichum lupini]
MRLGCRHRPTENLEQAGGRADGLNSLSSRTQERDGVVVQRGRRSGPTEIPGDLNDVIGISDGARCKTSLERRWEREDLLTPEGSRLVRGSRNLPKLAPKVGMKVANYPRMSEKSQFSEHPEWNGKEGIMASMDLLVGREQIATKRDTNPSVALRTRQMLFYRKNWPRRECSIIRSLQFERCFWDDVGSNCWAYLQPSCEAGGMISTCSEK